MLGSGQCQASSGCVDTHNTIWHIECRSLYAMRLLLLFPFSLALSLSLAWLPRFLCRVCSMHAHFLCLSKHEYDLSLYAHALRGCCFHFIFHNSDLFDRVRFVCVPVYGQNGLPPLANTRRQQKVNEREWAWSKRKTFIKCCMHIKMPI